MEAAQGTPGPRSRDTVMFSFCGERFREVLLGMCKSSDLSMDWLRYLHMPNCIQNSKPLSRSLCKCSFMPGGKSGWPFTAMYPTKLINYARMRMKITRTEWHLYAFPCVEDNSRKILLIIRRAQPSLSLTLTI